MTAAVAMMVDTAKDEFDDFEDIVDNTYGSTHARISVGDGEDSDIDGEFAIEGGGATEADNVFDQTVGVLQEMISGDEFQALLSSFYEQHAESFDESEENKLCHTTIFEQYTGCIEEFVEKGLAEEIPGFKMEDWLEELGRRQDEIDPDLMEVLISFSDFGAFKAQILAFKNREKTADLKIAGKATKIHRDEESDGEERPELGNLLQVTPA